MRLANKKPERQAQQPGVTATVSHGRSYMWSRAPAGKTRSARASSPPAVAFASSRTGPGTALDRKPGTSMASPAPRVGAPGAYCSFRGWAPGQVPLPALTVPCRFPSGALQQRSCLFFFRYGAIGCLHSWEWKQTYPGGISCNTCQVWPSKMLCQGVDDALLYSQAMEEPASRVARCPGTFTPQGQERERERVYAFQEEHPCVLFMHA